MKTLVAVEFKPGTFGPQVVTALIFDFFFIFFPCLSFIRTACQITFRSDIIEMKFRTFRSNRWRGFFFMSVYHIVQRQAVPPT